MLTEIGGGNWWNVYIGGPEATHRWQPEDVKAYEHAGISRFLLCYVGRQSDHLSLLNAAQGTADGKDAVQILKTFGMTAHGTPVCLDLEKRTFDAAPHGSLDYAVAWCQAVRQAGLRPGVYSNPGPLQALHERADRPDWVWIASWIRHTPASLDPHQATGMPASMWPNQGQRVWQYAGIINGKACTVGGFDVEIDVADPGCLVGTGVVPHPPPPPPHGHTYTVQHGDTLAAIARKFSIAGGWQQLFDLNRDVVKDPDVIHAGEVLKLP